MKDRAGVRAWYALGIVVVATLFGFVDRQVLVLVTEPLKRDMHLTDSRIGLLLGLGPGLFGASGAIVTGWLADRTARQVILCGCVLFWSLATAAFGIAHGFSELMIATVAVGLGEAALGPVFYSMAPDLFPGKTRPLANLIYYGAVTIGAGFGVALSGAVIGWVGAHRADLPAGLAALAAWRTAFILVAIPGVVIGPAILLIGQVKRQSARTQEVHQPSFAGYLRHNGLAFGAFCGSIGFYGMALYALFAWMPPHLIRDLHLSAQATGYGIGAAISLGTVVGLVAAGVGVKVLNRRFGVITPLRLYQTAMICAAAPLVLQLVANQPWKVYLLVGIQIAVSAMGTALSPTLMQDIAPAELRGRVIGAATFAYAAIAALAPILVGGVSDLLGAKA
ncbi:MAG TPA: MFS transporter, partial [Stellaceae bacterium]|nr:MFS transporter [Stellaceae bacterium]